MIKKHQKVVNKPNFISHKLFNKNFVAVHCSKTVLTLNKPIYIGLCILELSKLLMYQFHYHYVLKTFDNVKLLFRDTDSLVYEIKIVNVYDQCFKDKHLFDFSGYPKMYSLISSDRKEINKAKGVNKKLRHDEYLDVLFSCKT